MSSKCCDCCKVPTPGMFLNPLDEKDKLRLFKGEEPRWRWLKDPRGKIEFHPPREVYAPEYQYYSTRFSRGLNNAQGPDYGRSENMQLRIDGYGPTNV